MPRLSGVSTAAFIDDATQTVVRFENAHEDTTVRVRDMLEPQSADTRGDDYFVGYESEVNWMEPDLSSVQQMETWMTTPTDVQFVATGPQTIIQWYEPSRVRTRQTTNTNVGEVDPLHGLMRYGGGSGTNASGTIVGYPNGSHRIYASRNALYPLAYDTGVSIADVDGNNAPDGYTYTAGALSNEAVSSGTYEANGPTDGSTAERGVDLLMPIEGLTWTLSVDMQQLHDNGDTAIYLAALDDTGSALTSSEQIASTTGRISTEITTPAGTYEVRAVILRIKNANAQSAPAKVTEPALRVDGGTSYVTR